MADKTKIQWTDASWNPVTGCSKVSQGCKNCYALRDWPRLAANPKTIYYGRDFTDVQVHPERFDQPLRWAKPRKVFVNSMSDLFHDKVPYWDIVRIFAIMGLCFVMDRKHVFQILTKRPERMSKILSDDAFLTHVTIKMKQHGPSLPGENSSPTWPLPNVWLGVSVEDQETADERIPWLLATPDAVRWVSYEPALGPVNFERHFKRFHPGATPISTPGLDWIVVGGESGPRARDFHVDWARSTVSQCKAAGVACFVKQLGAMPLLAHRTYSPPKIEADGKTCAEDWLYAKLQDRHGGDMAEWPQDIRVREWPETQHG